MKKWYEDMSTTKSKGKRTVGIMLEVVGNIVVGLRVTQGNWKIDKLEPELRPKLRRYIAR